MSRIASLFINLSSTRVRRLVIIGSWIVLFLLLESNYFELEYLLHYDTRVLTKYVDDFRARLASLIFKYVSLNMSETLLKYDVIRIHFCTVCHQ